MFESHVSSAGLDSPALGPGQFYFKQAAYPEISDVRSSENMVCYSVSSSTHKSFKKSGVHSDPLGGNKGR